MSNYVDQKTHQRQIHTMWEKVKDLQQKLEEYKTSTLQKATEYTEQTRQEVIVMMYDTEQVVENAREETVLA